MCRGIWRLGGVGIAIGVGLFLGRGSARLAGAEQGTDKAGVDKGDFTVGEPIRFQNLAVFPVTSKVAKNQDRFITLDDGLKAGTVKVSEVGAERSRAGRAANRSTNSTERRRTTRYGRGEPTDDPFADGPTTGGPTMANVGGVVNRLLVTNNSDRPLYLMPGEIFVGGKQDRTLAQELIVPAGAQAMPICVYCVEHGRWAQRGESETTEVVLGLSDEASHSDVSQFASRSAGGEFPQSGRSLGKKARLSVQQGKGQIEVWDEVAQANRRTGARTNSGAYTANYVQPEVAGRLKPYVDSLGSRVAQSPRVVGVVVAVNGKVEAADVFESTPLFRKLWPKLLKSYALDAAAAGSNRTPPCTQAKAEAFLRKALEARVEEQRSDKGLVTTRADTGDVASFSLRERSDSPPPRDRAGAGAMGGGYGGVHTSAFSK